MFRCRHVAARLHPSGSVRRISTAATALLPTRPLLLPGRQTPLARAPPPPPPATHDSARSSAHEAAGHWPRHTDTTPPPHPPPPPHPRRQGAAPHDESPARYHVSVMTGDSAAQQANAAFRALFGQSHDASANDGAAAGGGAAIPDPFGTAAHESAGEEEVRENRHLYADDAVDEEGAVADGGSASTSAAATAAAAAPTETLGAHTELPSQALPGAAAHPVTLFGSRYGEAMALQLRTAAAQCGFVSPFWSSRVAFEDAGATVTVPDAEGVLLTSTLPTPVRVFNLQQTTLGRHFGDTAVPTVLAEMRRRRWATGADRRTTTSRDCVLDLCGFAAPGHRRDPIAASPHFARLQAADPRWVSAHELGVIDAAVRPEELDTFVEVPVFRSRPRRGTSDQPAAEGDADEAKAEIRVRMYNVSQLENQQRFQRLNPVQHAVARCYGSRGTRYACSTTWLMWEYCARYHFPVVGVPRIVFLTAEKVAMLGGDIVATKRYPHMATVMQTTAQEATLSAANGGTAAPGGAPPSTHAVPSLPASSTRDAGCDDGVVPPPFAVVMRGEVVTLYNALQTNIPDLIHRRCWEMRGRKTSCAVDN